MGDDGVRRARKGKRRRRECGGFREILSGVKSDGDW